MDHSKSKNFSIGKKTFARYNDEYNDLQINFIPIYLVEDNGDLYIGIKNDMIGTNKGYFPLHSLIGKNQISAKYLSNIYKKKD
jgi:hypothetical protein